MNGRIGHQLTKCICIKWERFLCDVCALYATDNWSIDIHWNANIELSRACVYICTQIRNPLMNTGTENETDCRAWACSSLNAKRHPVKRYAVNYFVLSFITNSYICRIMRAHGRTEQIITHCYTTASCFTHSI